MTIFSAHHTDMAKLEVQYRRRQLAGRDGIDFASNDYLGLADSNGLKQAIHAALDRGVPVGAGGSRLLRGNHPEHAALEAEAAAFFGAESALYFSTGYAANAALLATLPQRGDLVVYDAFIHASSHEGMRLSRAACLVAAHNNANSVADVINGWRKTGGTGQVWIAVESLYSMDGDKAPLADLVGLADQYEAILLIDEAHATGVFGDAGRGLAADYEGRDNIITLRTCGKALGCEGALLCGPKIMRECLINRGRAFIFSTAPSPLMAAAVRAALGLLVTESDRRQRLQSYIKHAEKLFAPFGIAAQGAQILPLILGDDARTMAVAKHLQENGFDVRGIRPPTVPVGTSRLRISLTLNVTEADITALAATLEHCW